MFRIIRYKEYQNNDNRENNVYNYQVKWISKQWILWKYWLQLSATMNIKVMIIMKKEKITIVRYNRYQNNDNYENNVYNYQV